MSWFIRTCQECGYELHTTRPIGEPTNSFLNRKCPKCKSGAFDYGKERNEPIETNPDFRFD